MKTRLATLLVIAAGSWATAVLAQDSAAQDADVRKLYNQSTPAAGATEEAVPAETGEVLPLVQFEDAPLVDVIKTLARQANLNLLFDPRVLAAGPDGRPAYPPVSIRLENVTAQNVLEAVLNNHNLRLERDPKTKIMRVTVRDPAQADPLELKIYQLKYTNPSNLVAILRPTLVARGSQAIPDGRTSQLIVLATEKELIEVDNLIGKLDTATRQVLIEARILETLRTPSSIKGINWAGTFLDQQFSFGNNSYDPESNQSLNPTLQPRTQPALMGFWNGPHTPATAFLNADGAHAVFSFFNQDSESEVIATPRAVTADNQPALLQVTRAIPIYSVTTGGTQTGPTVDITYTNLGTILEVTPRVSANSNIALRVVPEVSDVESVDRKIIFGDVFEANIFKIRKIETQVLIPSGNTLVLGGLISDNTGKVSTKVPILGDLPGMRYVFGSKSKTRTKSNLLIFVTPTVVEDDDFRPTQTDFLQSPIPMDRPEKDFGSFDGPWDGTEPYDWNQPVY